MMKTILTVVMLLTGITAFAQSKINESFPLTNEDKIAIKFEYPTLVKIHTWEKNEVKVDATVEIEGGDQDETFSIKGKSERGTFYLKSKLTGLSRSENYFFNSDDDDDESVTIKENGRSIVLGEDNVIKRGVEIEIVVDVYVPENLAVDVNAKFGLVEVLDVPRKLDVDSEFGGIDVAINTRDIRELDASTTWGQIYSNLESKIDLSGGDSIGEEMRASLNSSGRKKLYLDSQFGNVYIRKH